MSLLLAYRSNLSPLEIERGLARVRDHYDLPPDASTDAFHCGSLGAWFAWRDYDNQKPYRHSRDEETTAWLTHIPYGYSRTIASAPGDPQFANDVGRRLRADPSTAADFAAPFASVLTDRRSYIRIAVDGVGLARLFRYKTPRGTFISNRAIAAILLSGEVPGPSELGWSSQLMFGYFWDDLSPFDGVKTFKASEYVELTQDDVSFGDAAALSRWMAGEAEPLFDGFDRTIAEMQQAVSTSQYRVNLSGGRDSRATAAMLTASLGEQVLLKTAYPPLVERDAASPLIAKLPYFERYNGENEAWSKDRIIWMARPRFEMANDLGLMERAHIHLRNWEGSALASHMIAGIIEPKSAFHSGDMILGLGGGGGEISKAYGWSNSKKPSAVLKAIREVRLPHRLMQFVLTQDRSVGMLRGSPYLQHFWPMLTGFRAEAAQVGLTNYLYLNYHLLMTRVGRAAGLGVSDTNVPLFLGPHYISAALRQTPQEMVQANMHRAITHHYRPEWDGMAYEGDLHTSPDRRVGLPAAGHVWRGPQADEFREIIADARSFGEPYDHQKIMERFAEPEDNPNLLNQRAFDLIYRAAFMELLSDLRRAVKH